MKLRRKLSGLKEYEWVHEGLNSPVIVHHNHLGYYTYNDTYLPPYSYGYRSVSCVQETIISIHFLLDPSTHSLPGSITKSHPVTTLPSKLPNSSHLSPTKV